MEKIVIKYNYEQKKKMYELDVYNTKKNEL